MQKLCILLSFLLITPDIPLFAKALAVPVYKIYLERGMEASSRPPDDEKALGECAMEHPQKFRVKRKQHAAHDLFTADVFLVAGNSRSSTTRLYSFPFIDNIRLLFPKHYFW